MRRVSCLSNLPSATLAPTLLSSSRNLPAEGDPETPSSTSMSSRSAKRGARLHRASNAPSGGGNGIPEESEPDGIESEETDVEGQGARSVPQLVTDGHRRIILIERKITTTTVVKTVRIERYGAPSRIDADKSEAVVEHTTSAASSGSGSSDSKIGASGAARSENRRSTRS